jgi:hypothetical protein
MPYDSLYPSRSPRKSGRAFSKDTETLRGTVHSERGKYPKIFLLNILKPELAKILVIITSTGHNFNKNDMWREAKTQASSPQKNYIANQRI